MNSTIKELPEEIKEMISTEALAYGQNPAFSGGTKLNTDKYAGYVAASAKYVGEMAGFVEWCNDNYLAYYEDTVFKFWTPHGLVDWSKQLTTSELLIEYFKSKNNPV